MRRIALILLTLGVLAGCSGHTRYTAEVDVLSFLPEDDASGELDLVSTTIYLPDADGDLTTRDGGFLAQVPEQVVDGLDRAGFNFAATVENTGSAPTGVSVELYLAPSSEDSDIYQPQYRVEGADLELGTGESGELSLAVSLSEDENEEAYRRIRDGGGEFRVGVKVSTDAGSLSYELTDLRVSLTTKPLGELIGR